MKILSEERGNILILAALSMTMLLSFMAMAIDVGNLYYTQRKLQTLADAAAMAGALEVDTCIGAGTLNCGAMQTAAVSALTENGSSAATVRYDVASASPSETGLLLIVNNGPRALGSSDPNAGSKYYVEAVVAKQVPTYFAKIFGKSTSTISARAEAGKSIPAYPPCVLTTGTTGNDINVNGGGTITNAAGANCAVISDSTDTSGCSATVNGTVSTSALSTAGAICDTNGGAVVPSNTKASADVVPDPLKKLVAPTAEMASAYGSYSPGGISPSNGKTNYPMSPGLYSGDVNFNGGTYGVTMAPGLYYFTGSVNFSNTGTISGNGVTLVFAPGTKLTMNSGVTFSVSAPNDSTQDAGVVEASGAYNDMLIWVPGKTGDTGDNFILDAETATTLNGAVYVPNGQIELNGHSTVHANGSIISRSLDVNGTLILGCSAMQNGVCPGGGSGGGNGGSTIIALAE